MSRRYPKLTAGFTVVELLVVIGIIAVLMALMLPAVQRVREAAAQTQCVNNLKNVGLALHDYEAAYKCFPPGAVNTYWPNPPFPGVPENVSHGWVPFILPYLEQQALYEQYRFDLDFRDPGNRDAVLTPLPLLQCPSARPNRVDIFTSGGFVDWQTSCIDYAPIKGVKAGLAPKLIDRADSYDGVMKENYRTPISEITDGLSSTVVIGEDAGRPQNWQWGQSYPDLRSSGGGWADVDNRFSVKGAPPSPTATGNACAINCTNDNEVYSFHPGGANFLFADSSVRFISAGITIRELARLITKAGGEVVGEY